MKKNILYIDKFDNNKYIEEFEDFILAKGGDGTLLKAINKFKYKNKPFFGLAAGTKNFLMNHENYIFRNAKYKKFDLIKVKVFFKKNNIAISKTLEGFNDIAIGGIDGMASWIHFSVKEKDNYLGEFYGGGLIISSSQGTTAINKNNGGVVLPLSSSLWSITGDKTDKLINYVVKPHKLDIKVSSRQKVNIWIDGRNHIIKNISRVIVTKGSKVEVIFNKYKDFKKKRRV